MYRPALIATLIMVGCPQASEELPTRRSEETRAAQASNRQVEPPHLLDTEHLPNAVLVQAKVISGGLPEGDVAFQELQSLGVKTVISVDGQKPDVETAAKYGLRYVHLPHGYDGIPVRRAKELAKAVRELDGPVYIHCHHGKHRSPVAATVACVTAGFISRTGGMAVLELAGTSPTYRGLYESARQARQLKDCLLDELEVEFREFVEVPPMVEAMVAIEQTHNHLKEIAAAGWRTPAKHPDLDPAHEALLMREHFAELLRTDFIGPEFEAFRLFLKTSENAAQELELVLRHWQPETRLAGPPAAAPVLLARITTSCMACHQAFRDVLLLEK